MLMFFFFFQAEDGIRDVAVTGVQTCALPISILAWSGVMRPGQLGPISRLEVPWTNCLARTMSVTGIPSVMQTTSDTPAAAASMMASAAAMGGTKINAQSARSALTDSSTVFQTAKPSWVVPPLPGVTPPTTVVPYSLQRAAWNAPSLPVIPCTTTRVPLSTRMLTGLLGGGLRPPSDGRRELRSRSPCLPPTTAPAKPALERARASSLPFRERNRFTGTVAHVLGHRQR